MTFATVSDLQSRFGQLELLLLADRDNTGTIDPGVVEACLQDADAEIVSLIGKAVTIDQANVPLNLVRLACDIARYRLYGAGPTEDVRKRYEDAVKMLIRVANGDATLDGGPGAPTEAAVQTSPMAAATAPGSRIFTRGL